MAQIQTFLPIALMTSVFIAVLFPTTVGLADPFGIDEIRAQNAGNSTVLAGNLNNYYANESVGFFTNDGNVVKTDDQIEDIINLPSSGDQTVFSDVGFGFLDYVKIAFNAAKSLFTFLVIPVILLFNMGYPFNILFALPYSLLYIFSLVSYILGR